MIKASNEGTGCVVVFSMICVQLDITWICCLKIVFQFEVVFTNGFIL
jgi:hypothetical protein